MIDWDMAWRIRTRGLQLPKNGEYSCEELKNLAIEQCKLFDKADSIDTIIYDKSQHIEEKDNVE